MVIHYGTASSIVGTFFFEEPHNTANRAPKAKWHKFDVLIIFTDVYSTLVLHPAKSANCEYGSHSLTLGSCESCKSNQNQASKTSDGHQIYVIMTCILPVLLPSAIVWIFWYPNHKKKSCCCGWDWLPNGYQICFDHSNYRIKEDFAIGTHSKVL